MATKIPPLGNMAENFRLGKPVYNLYGNTRFDVNRDVEVIRQACQHTFDPKDILVASYPKSGTHWMMALVTLILSEGKEIEHPFYSVPKRIGEVSSLDVALKKQPPHYFYTHLPFNFLKDCFRRSQPKVIYMMRNPFDQLVSLYNFSKIYKPYGLYTGSWDEFYNDIYKKNELFYGNNLEHLAGWWNAREGHKDHILYVKYEDMKKDLQGTLTQVASFLGKELDEHVTCHILEQLSFRNMQKNEKVNQISDTVTGPSVPSFIRKGIVGDWKNYFNPDQKREVEEEYQKKIACLGLTLES